MKYNLVFFVTIREYDKPFWRLLAAPDEWKTNV